MALYALQPALLEESWARLFLLPFLYAMFRSASGPTTGRALLAALLLSVAIHGSAHAPQSITSVSNALFTASTARRERSADATWASSSGRTQHGGPLTCRVERLVGLPWLR